MPSPLQNFVQASQKIAFAVIGAEPFTIDNGPEVFGIMNENSQTRSFEDGGFEPTATFQIIIGAAEFKAAYPRPISDYLPLVLRARGKEWRITVISSGQPTDGQFVSISLDTPNRSS